MHASRRRSALEFGKTLAQSATLREIMQPIFRLFVDEVGHASMKATEHPNEQYLSLTGVIMRLQHEQESFGPALDALKIHIFGTREIVLHRTEIASARQDYEKTFSRRRFSYQAAKSRRRSALEFGKTLPCVYKRARLPNAKRL